MRREEGQRRRRGEVGGGKGEREGGGEYGRRREEEEGRMGKWEGQEGGRGRGRRGRWSVKNLERRKNPRLTVGANSRFSTWSRAVGNAVTNMRNTMSMTIRQATITSSTQSWII